MPVQFYCPHCRQLLKVGRRKIGTLVACPRCGSPTVVPDARSGSAPLAEESIAGFDDINELLRQPAVVPPVPAAGASAPIAWSPAGFQPAPYSPSGMSIPPDTLDMVVVSRSAIYIQAALFLVVACVAFAAGYWVGHSGSSATTSKSAAAKAKAEPVRLRGTITYNISMGRAAPDDEALVLALPVKPPPGKLKAKGLRPGDPKDAVQENAAARLDASGGGFARANAQGAYELVVRPGEYQVLIISSHAQRPPEEHLPAADLKVLAPYFEVVTELLDSHQYALTRQRLAGSPNLSHTF